MIDKLADRSRNVRAASNSYDGDEFLDSGGRPASGNALAADPFGIDVVV